MSIKIQPIEHIEIKEVVLQSVSTGSKLAKNYPIIQKHLAQEDEVEINNFLETIHEIISDAIYPPSTKFYAILLLLKVSEFQNVLLMRKLVKHTTLLDKLFKDAQIDFRKNSRIRGKKLFSKNPSDEEALIGSNIANLLTEAFKYWYNSYPTNEVKTSVKIFEVIIKNLRDRMFFPRNYAYVGSQNEISDEYHLTPYHNQVFFAEDQIQDICQFELIREGPDFSVIEQPVQQNKTSNESENDSKEVNKDNEASVDQEYFDKIKAQSEKLSEIKIKPYNSGLLTFLENNDDEADPEEEADKVELTLDRQTSSPLPQKRQKLSQLPSVSTPRSQSFGFFSSSTTTDDEANKLKAENNRLKIENNKLKAVIQQMMSQRQEEINSLNEALAPPQQNSASLKKIDNKEHLYIFKKDMPSGPFNLLTCFLYCFEKTQSQEAIYSMKKLVSFLVISNPGESQQALRQAFKDIDSPTLKNNHIGLQNYCEGLEEGTIDYGYNELKLMSKHYETEVFLVEKEKNKMSMKFLHYGEYKQRIYLLLQKNKNHYDIIFRNKDKSKDPSSEETVFKSNDDVVNQAVLKNYFDK